MERKVSRASIVAAIVSKDIRAFTRDTIWVMLSIVGLVAYVTVFYLMPEQVNEQITVGVHEYDLEEVLGEFEEQEEGLTLVEFDSEEDLEAVIAGELQAWDTPDGLYLRDREADDPKPEEGTELDVGIGLAFPDGFVESAVLAGQGAADAEKSTVTVYMDASVPSEYRNAMTSAVREIGYAVRTAAMGGTEEDMIPVGWPDEDEIILGEDRAGEQIPLRDKLRPMLAFFVLMIESFSLAGLVAMEVQSRTVTAVLVTPAKQSDFLVAKGITGTTLAFLQATLILALVGGFTASTWAPLLAIILMGAVMVTGVSMLVGAAGKDFMGTLYFGMLALIPLIIPSFAALFPGTAADWVQYLPSYGIIKALVDVTAYGESWAGIGPDLGLSAAWVVAILAAGVWALRRKVASL
jgi:ABC-2 type transport system permease protein